MNKSKIILVLTLIGFLSFSILLSTPTKATPTLKEESSSSEIHRIEYLKEKQLLKNNRIKNNVEKEIIEIEVTVEQSSEETIEYSEYFYDASDLMYYGVIYADGYRYTFYQESVLSGDGLNIPGRRSDYDTGFIRDEYGNICLASSDLAYGTIVQTLWGQGCVYDCGCSSGTLDVYLCW